MLTDFEKVLGNEAINIEVCYKQKEKNNEPIIIDNLFNQHLITGIKKDDSIYVADPTNRCLVSFNNSKYINNFKQYNDNYIYGEPISINKNNDNSPIYIILDKDKKDINFKNESINRENYTDKYIEASIKIAQNNKLINDFFNEKKQQLEKINQLNRSLIPLSNEKVKKWKIR